jgi:hypothetical protein
MRADRLFGRYGFMDGRRRIARAPRARAAEKQASLTDQEATADRASRIIVIGHGATIAAPAERLAGECREQREAMLGLVGSDTG